MLQENLSNINQDKQRYIENVLFPFGQLTIGSNGRGGTLATMGEGGTNAEYMGPIRGSINLSLHIR